MQLLQMRRTRRCAQIRWTELATKNGSMPMFIKRLIVLGASALELRRKAVDEGMITLRGSGLRKVKDGVTTIEEVVRETVK